MGLLQKLDQEIAARALHLQQAGESGTKIIGVSGLGYIPDELVHAAGAIPLRLVRGGDPEPLAAASAYMDRILCPFSRAQIGYRMLDEEPRYQMIDCFACAITCQHMRRVADAFEFYTDLDVFRLGVPHAPDTEPALQYYLEMARRFRAWLETVTGTKITDEKLAASVELYNRMRSLLAEISALRSEAHPLISGKEFISIMHASFYLDPADMVKLLEEMLPELKARRDLPEQKGPRMLLTGNMLAVGDYKVVDIIEDLGGRIVMEQFCGGVRHYRSMVEPNGDIMESIARRYLGGKEPCGFMRPARSRLDLVAQLAKEYAADGIVWYQLRYCDTYNMEFFYFNTMMKELGIPVLKLESEYDVEERGTLLNRIESFVESLEGRI